MFLFLYLIRITKIGQGGRANCHFFGDMTAVRRYSSGQFDGRGGDTY